jgi:hypothetical protein
MRASSPQQISPKLTTSSGLQSAAKKPLKTARLLRAVGTAREGSQVALLGSVSAAS